MSEKTADTINTLLKGVVEDGTGTQAGLDEPGQRGQDRYDATSATRAWFVGYTPNMAGAVWVGDPAHKRQDEQHHHRRRLPTTRSSAATSPGPIWRDAMTGALEGKDAPAVQPRPHPDRRHRTRTTAAATSDNGDEDGNDGDNGGNGGGNGGGNNGGNGGRHLPDPGHLDPGASGTIGGNDERRRDENGGERSRDRTGTGP